MVKVVRPDRLGDEHVRAARAHRGRAAHDARAPAPGARLRGRHRAAPGRGARDAARRHPRRAHRRPPARRRGHRPARPAAGLGARLPAPARLGAPGREAGQRRRAGGSCGPHRPGPGHPPGPDRAGHGHRRVRRARAGRRRHGRRRPPTSGGWPRRWSSASPARPRAASPTWPGCPASLRPLLADCLRPDPAARPSLGRARATGSTSSWPSRRAGSGWPRWPLRSSRMTTAATAISSATPMRKVLTIPMIAAGVGLASGRRAGRRSRRSRATTRLPITHANGATRPHTTTRDDARGPAPASPAGGPARRSRRRRAVLVRRIVAVRRLAGWRRLRHGDILPPPDALECAS